MTSDGTMWDDVKAAALIGKTVVIGITYLRDDEADIVQRHGTVRRATRDGTVEIELAGPHAGEMFTLPPDTEVFRPAAPGHYRLRSSGEVVIDPDFTVTYTVHPPPRG